MNLHLNHLPFQISTEVSKLPQSRFLPRPPGHDSPLKLETPKFNPMSSEDWLKLHGLRGNWVTWHVHTIALSMLLWGVHCLKSATLNQFWGFLWWINSPQNPLINDQISLKVKWRYSNMTLMVYVDNKVNLNQMRAYKYHQ